MRHSIRTASGTLGIAALALTLSAGPATAAPAGPGIPDCSTVPGSVAPSPTVPRPVHDRGVVVYEAGDVELHISQNAEGDIVVEVPGPVSTASKQELSYIGPEGVGSASAALCGSTAVVPVEADGTYRIRYRDTDGNTIRAIGEATAVVRDGQLKRVFTPNYRRGETVSVSNTARGTLVVKVPRHRADDVAWSLHRDGVTVRLNTDQLATTRLPGLPDGHYALSASSGDQAGPLSATTITFTVRNGWITG
ncbi:hypothetical protein GCM10025781_06460 [Kocuria gwangalliensis]|uniref:Uncharacterized protein n=1 Tax=Kocuria gwangalliensis TaxID=501592 RepID=A0ABP8WN50_9MICC